MKLLQRLTQPLETQGLRARQLWTKWETQLHQITDQHLRQHSLLPVARSPHPSSGQSKSGQSNGSSGQPNGHVIRNVSSGTASRSSLLVAATVLVITSAIGHRFYNAPKLDVGKAAPQTIVAPASATVEDAKATEEKRKVARREATSVLMLDQAINQKIEQAIQQQLNQANELRQLAGGFPFAKTATLSNSVQTYLRKASAQDWSEVVMAVNQATRPRKRASQELKPTALDANQQKAFAELRSHRRAVSAADYIALVDTINEARSQYQAALKSLPKLVLPETTPVFDASLLDLSNSEWRRLQTRLLQAVDRILAQGIPSGLPQPLLAEAVRLQVTDWVPTGTETIATNLLLASLQPNLVHDETQTRLSAERAAQDVKPEIVTIKQGEAIVYAGESITTADFALLDHFKLSRRGVDWVGLIGFGVVVGGAVGIYWLVERRFHPGMRRRDRTLIVLLTLSTPLLVALNVPSTNLSAIGLLVGSFYGSPLGIAVAALLAFCLPLGTVLPWSHLLSSAAGGILCGYMAGRLRSREELALLGAAVGVLQGALYLALNVVSGVGIYTLLGATVIHGLIGLAWSIVAIGVSPYLEQLFDLVTTIRLVELSNPNRPLLKKLAAKTPGTFQHTLFVATLAEAAARALGCNVELVRTGTLYHDIGKMHDPLGFIENQMGGPNKHDLIDNPWKSAAIIKKHVTEGIVMARKYRLPKAVQSFIPEHQGTMLIAYFYHQAQQRSQEAVAQGKPAPTVNDADFQYDGPAPRSRETGVVMLADSCEAALRSLKDATPKEALAMINKILRARWQDQQLANSGLTREDMSKIATVFVEVWQQSNHQRIAYPSKPINIQPSASKV
ncbi:HDIG domain-containing protein [Phormidium sp. FACHB-592]|uniref:HDIG domain-containing protein n=1 Tax=Stenomitos frigidus AS-A4 TaxID=2933935 RepID=A0ABV0KNT8_9CYAN|nr:HDIG domain-containing metalloprotein [Phormidium sp. FACHB-592]MBD2073279.1 HDIG domain-containing protein [Phormidium sp. FACHB-592]